MTKNEAFVLTAFTGILLCPIDEFRDWLAVNVDDDPFDYLFEDARDKAFARLRAKYRPEIDRMHRETFG